MVEIIESNPEILGGKPVIKGTRIPVDLIFELISLNYSLDQIIEQYPTLSKDVILRIIRLGTDVQENLKNVDLKRYLEKEIAEG
ncbi:MAG: DUF433 domain-containing protein [Candidatus Helarchaeota archaeon]|nr:DUF433 domain-containing protein [Candidatus Helarchaeota archaeon]